MSAPTTLRFILGFAAVICAIELARGENVLDVAGLFLALAVVLAGAFTLQAVIYGAGAVAFWKAAFRITPPPRAAAVVELVPVYALPQTRRGSIRRRFMVLCVALAGVCLLMATRLANATTADHESFALVWVMLAVIPAALAVLTGVASWVVTGRI